MKLILAILSEEDTPKVSGALMKEGFRVTRLCSVGGYLRQKNTTLLIGVQKEQLDKAIRVIRECVKRHVTVRTDRPEDSMNSSMSAYPGSTAFESYGYGERFSQEDSHATSERVSSNVTLFVLPMDAMEQL